MSGEVLEVIETPLFTCDCGCNWFEKKQVCQFQQGSKYAVDKFIPITIMDLLKCAYCGNHYNEDGIKTNIDVLMIPVK